MLCGFVSQEHIRYNSPVRVRRKMIINCLDYKTPWNGALICVLAESLL